MVPFRQLFAEIEARIYRHWDREAPDHLATAATLALEQSPELLAFDAARCLQWALDEHAQLPEQSWTFDFGQPAITVTRNDDFRIDLLYWIENASAIHDHITCGAFSALHGQRLHGLYEFAAEERLGPWIETGRLTRKRFEVMREGDARPIRPDLVHDLFWLGKPSVTLVVRCADHPGTNRKPRSFWTPGLALVPKAHHDTSLVSRRAEGLDLMRLANEDMYAEALARILEGNDPSLAYYAFTAAAVSSPNVLDTVLAGLTRPSAVIPHLALARPQVVRRPRFAGLYTADSASRLLVGLLWADADEAESRDAIEAAFPGENPETVIKTGVSALEEISPDSAEQARSLLGSEASG